jgi:hypothetical protein
MADQFTPEERGLIERLQNAPQPNLNPDRFEAIRAQILNAMDVPPLSPAPRPGFTPSVPLIGAAVVIIVVVVIVSVILKPQSAIPTPSLTAPPTVIMTPTPEATAENTPEATVEATEETTPEATPESTDEAVIVIEGPVDSINGNIITIFGVTVEIDPNDPLLGIIQIGDVIHIEGNNGTTVITATTITYVNIEVNINSSTGEVWKDTGSCDHPPPDWAPANGWRRRCQGQTQPQGQQGNGSSGKGNGMGKP